MAARSSRRLAFAGALALLGFCTSVAAGASGPAVGHKAAPKALAVCQKSAAKATGQAVSLVGGHAVVTLKRTKAPTACHRVTPVSLRAHKSTRSPVPKTVAPAHTKAAPSAGKAVTTTTTPTATTTAPRPAPTSSAPAAHASAPPAPASSTTTTTAATPAASRPPAARQGQVLLGTAFQEGLVQTDPTYRQQLLSHGYQVLTPEFEFYMDQVEKQPGQFDFSLPDAQVAFAQQNGLAIRGHVLIWGMQLPGWLTNPAVPWTRATLIPVLEQWITTMVSRYRGEIHEWDVVNEPLNDDGTLKPNLWEQVIGPDYISLALEAAHAADPSALLYINEYSTEYLWPKSDALYALAQTLLAAGVPLDGIGFQVHSDTRWPVPYSDLMANMARFGALGLRTDITEMDVNTTYFTGTEAAKLAAEAQIYSDAARACEESPSCFTFTTWGFTDKVSWLGSAAEGLPFDVNYQPKPAWAAIQAALRP